MREIQQSLSPEGPAPARHRAAWVYGRAYRSIKEAGARIKETTLRLLPGFPGAPPTVQRANRAAAADIDGFSGFMGSNGGWAREQGPLIGFGKYIGRPLKVLAGEDPGYLQWILSHDFSPEVKDIIGGALRGEC